MGLCFLFIDVLFSVLSQEGISGLGIKVKKGASFRGIYLRVTCMKLSVIPSEISHFAI